MCFRPEPALIGKASYLPEPVTEYPNPSLLPDDLWRRIEQHEQIWRDEAGVECYQYDLAVAPGWKIGGWDGASFGEPTPVACGECGARQEPFLHIPSSEWDMGSGSWILLEDTLPNAWPNRGPIGAESQVQVQIGRGYGMQIYTCPSSHDHPPGEFMQ